MRTRFGGDDMRQNARSRGGFTLVELLVVVAIVGILAGLALPNLRTMIYRARASEISGVVDVIRVAAFNYSANNNGQFPAESGLGSIPSGLASYLPDGFTFSGDGYTLDYENWTLPSGLPNDPNTTRLIGVSVAADDEMLANAILEVLAGAVVFSVDNTHTFVIDRS